MAINTLKVATAGYLKRTTKAVLVIAVAGYLNFGGTPPIPPSPPSGGGGGGSNASRHNNRNEEKRIREQKERIAIEDSEIIEIVKLTLKHFII